MTFINIFTFWERGLRTYHYKLDLKRGVKTEIFTLFFVNFFFLFFKFEGWESLIWTGSSILSLPLKYLLSFSIYPLHLHYPFIIIYHLHSHSSFLHLNYLWHLIVLHEIHDSFHCDYPYLAFLFHYKVVSALLIFWIIEWKSCYHCL